jgi:hypothetical protein
MAADSNVIVGEMEDGGVEMKVYVNDKLVCTSKAEYSNVPRNPRNTKSVSVEWSSIGRMTECDTPFKLLRGDKIVIESFFDFEKHPM